MWQLLDRYRNATIAHRAVDPVQISRFLDDLTGDTNKHFSAKAGFR